MNAGLNAMVSMFSQFEKLGTKKTSNGTVLYGKAPHVGSEAYLHAVFPSCPESGLERIEANVGMPLPPALRSFVKLSNGLDVFVGTLSIFGWRENFKRTVEAVQSQPFSIITPNTIERPQWIEPTHWIFGRYNWDGTAVCLGRGAAVTARAPGTGEIRRTWKSLDDFLKTEAQRLRGLFDDQGREIDEESSTLPGG